MPSLQLWGMPSMSSLPRVGFVGTGTIAEALVDGLCFGGEQRADILLSPRNAEVADRIVRRYPFAVVAADNQAVLDGSDIVVIAVTPQIAEAVLKGLVFKPDHIVISLVATFDLARLRPLVAPATSIARATPLPAVAKRVGPLLLHPPLPEVAALLDGLGQVIHVQTEADMDAFLTVTALMGSYFGLLEGISGWLTGRVEDTRQVDDFVGAMFHALGRSAEARAAEGFGQLVVAHSTPKGLNEQAWRELKGAGWASVVGEVLDLVHARIQRRAGFEDRLPPR
jgi:pyrroline-5-carboxylate reductase